MDGKQLLEQYMSRRDYSNSDEDHYAVLLSSIVFNCAGFDIFSALEKAEAENKKLIINYPESTDEIIVEEIQPQWITMI